MPIPVTVAHSSSCDSSSLLIVADAINGHPIILKNITSQSKDHEIVRLNEKDYKYKNRCAAYSPLFHAALVITRSGTVKLANCSPGVKTWTVVEVGERMDVATKQWQCCSLAFSRDGYRALALDRKGRLLVTDFITA